MKKAKFLVMSLVLAVLMLAAGVLFAACNEGEEEPPAHTHTWSTEWSGDEDSHWHACTGEGCTAIADEALHTWDEGEVTTPATYDAAGVRTYTCEVCGREREEAIAQLEHTYATEWTYDDDNHWHACTDEGYEDLKADVAAHDWDSGEVTTPATFEAPGVRTHTCTVCDATKTEDIAQLEHAFSDEWSYTTTHHWHACIDEGYDLPLGDNNYAFLRKDEAYHSFGEGVLSEDGTYKTYTCEDCGYSKTSQIVTVEAGESVILQSTEDSKTSSDISLYPDIGEIWVMDGIYAFRLSDDTPVGSAWIARSTREQYTDGWNVQTQDPDTSGKETEFRVYLPAIDFTKYTSVSFNIITNNALGFSLTDAEGRVSFPAETSGTITYTYDATKSELNVTFAVGEVTSSATITDAATISGLAKITFLVWGQNFTSIDIGSIKGTVTASTTEQYTIYSFDNGAECGYDGRYDIVPGVGGQGVFWHNGVYCYDETVGIYKWVAGSSSKYENGMHIETQTGAETDLSTYTVYLPLIDFTTYQNVTFKVSGNNDFQTESIGFGDEMIALGNAEVVFTLQYDEETGNVNITLVNATKDAQMTYTLTDADVISGEKAFTYNVKGYWFGAIEMSPIINTFTLA